MLRGIFAILLAGFAPIAGCSRLDTARRNSPASGSPTTGDWIVVRYEAEPETLNPYTVATTIATYAMFGANNSQIYEFLLGSDPENLNVSTPLLAESLPEVSEDHLTYIFTIREGVKWHDGKPLTTEDVVFSFKAAMCPLVDSASIRSYLTNLTDVARLENRKIRLSMSKPDALHDPTNAVSIVPKHVFDPDGLLDGITFKDIIGTRGKTDSRIKAFSEAFNKHPNSRSPIGTGPYKFEKWDTGKEIVLARNDDYWGQKAYLDKIIIRIIPDDTTALTALKSGELDLNPRLTPIQYAQQTSGAAFDGQFKKITYSNAAFSYIGWNAERAFFNDKRVRQALTMLVNRRQILDTVRFGLGRIAVGPFTPGSPDFNRNIQALPYDPKRAAELLDEAGWKDSNGDGIRDKDGVAFRFELLFSSSNTTGPPLVAILKEELRKVGIEMSERRLEANVFVGNLREHKFDAVTAQWTIPLIQDPYQLWHSSSATNKGSNFVSFANTEADRLMEEARLEFDSGKRRQLYWRFQEIVHEEQPYTFLWYAEEAAVYDKRFQNVRWIAGLPGYDLNAWFVPKAFQKFGLTR